MKRPQILLLGNGINRAFNSDSWDELLSSINKFGDKYDVSKLRCPETLKAILVTGDKVDEALAKKKRQLSDLGTEKPSGQIAMLRRLLDIGFDGILTTNYSYELETAALGTVCENKLRRIQRHTDEVKRCEPRFMLHSYNSVTYNGVEQRIWHVHGEARKHDSMILGHYYYGTLLGKMLEIDKKRGNRYFFDHQAGKPPRIGAWTDAFILGDVYILGFGFGFAETDMWWLLNRKKREYAGVRGKTFFYELNPSGKKDCEKLDLLSLMNVKILPFTVEDRRWADAYSEAIDDIEKRVKGK